MRLSRSQQEIVKLLRRYGAMTVEDLSRTIGITGVAVRQHLDVLEAEGLLDSRPERRPIGRPRRLYRLTEAADDLFPKNYHGLAEGILEHLEATGGRESVDEVFRVRRRRLEAELAPRLAGMSLAERVAAVARFQDDAGYMAEWEAAADGTFLLREHNCTICRIARRFSQVCENELAFIRNMTGGEVERESHIASGDAVCTYRVRQPAPPENP